MNVNLTERYYRRFGSARAGVLLIVCLSAFLTPLSLSAILVAVPAISHGLQANAVHASWLPAAFLLSNLIALLPSGRLADLYGRKRLFLIGNFIYVIASVLAAFSNSIEALLLLRVAQGIGAAMFFSTGMAILSSVYRDSGRGAALGWMVACVYLGLSSGPLIGGWAVDTWDWRAVFLIQVPFALVTIIAGLWVMKGEWRSHEPHAVDWLGVLYLAVGVLCFFVGATNLFRPWGMATTLVALGFFYLFTKQCYATPYPLVNIPMVVRNKTYSRALLASVCMYSGQYGLVFLMGLYLQYNRGFSPTQAGQMLMLQALVMAACAPFAGRLSDRLDARLLATFGCLMIASGQFILMFISDQLPIFFIVAGLMIIGLGHGMFSTPNNSSALGTIPEQRMGIASALLNQSRLVGQLLGTIMVSFLMALYIGNEVIEQSHLGDMLQVARLAITFSLICALLAAFFSWRKA